MSRNASFNSGSGKINKTRGDEAWYETVRDGFNNADKGAVARELTGGDTSKDNDTWMPDWLDERLPKEVVDTAKGIGQAVNFGSNLAKGVFYGAKDLGQYSASQLTKNPFNRDNTTSGIVDNPYSSNPSGPSNSWDNGLRPLLEAGALFGPKIGSGVIRAGKAGIKEGAKASVKAVAPKGAVDLTRSSVDDVGERIARPKDELKAETQANFTRDVNNSPRYSESKTMGLGAKKAVAGAMLALSSMGHVAPSVAKDVVSVVKTVPANAAKALEREVAAVAPTVSKVTVRGGATIEDTLTNAGKSSAHINVNKSKAAEKAASTKGAVGDTTDTSSETNTDVQVPTTVANQRSDSQQQQQQQQQSTSSAVGENGGSGNSPSNKPTRPRNTPDSSNMQFPGEETNIPLTA